MQPYEQFSVRTQRNVRYITRNRGGSCIEKFRRRTPQADGLPSLLPMVTDGAAACSHSASPMDAPDMRHVTAVCLFSNSGWNSLLAWNEEPFLLCIDPFLKCSPSLEMKSQLRRAYALQPNVTVFPRDSISALATRPRLMKKRNLPQSTSTRPPLR
jgi:hypothetical protein